MTTVFTWMVPSFYETPEDSDLRFDLTNHARTLLANKPWERCFDYGYTPSLEKLDPITVERVEFVVTPLVSGALSFEGQNELTVEQHCGADCLKSLPPNSRLVQWNRNFLVMLMELSTPVDNPSADEGIAKWSIEHVGWTHR